MSDSNPTSWVLASQNSGKLCELGRLLQPLQVKLLAQSELSVPDCDEPHETFIENALRKARHASSYSGMPALADDSGLCVPALKGLPGVLSARYATLSGLERSDENNNKVLLKNMEGVADRVAYFVCSLVWVAHASDPTPVVVQRFWWGRIQESLVGENGFGYDPLFYVPSQRCTAAQLSAADKNQLGHRGQAASALLAELQLRLGNTCEH